MRLFLHCCSAPGAPVAPTSLRGVPTLLPCSQSPPALPCLPASTPKSETHHHTEPPFLRVPCTVPPQCLILHAGFCFPLRLWLQPHGAREISCAASASLSCSLLLKMKIYSSQNEGVHPPPDGQLLTPMAKRALCRRHSNPNSKSGHGMAHPPLLTASHRTKEHVHFSDLYEVHPLQ